MMYIQDRYIPTNENLQHSITGPKYRSARVPPAGEGKNALPKVALCVFLKLFSVFFKTLL